MVLSRHSVICLLLALLFSSAAEAQVPEITTAVNRKQILIGEQIRLYIEVRMPDNLYRLTWAKTPEDFGAFVLASQGKIDSSYTTGFLTFGQDLYITSFDSGRQVIPPLHFEFDALRGDSSFRMMTDSIPIEVRFSPPDDVLPFHDIKPVITVEKEYPSWFWPVVIAALLLLIIALYFLFRKKKKKNDGLFDSPLSDYEEAMQLIEELRRDELPAKAEFKAYFSRMTDIFKRYISRRSHTNKMHFTGAEINSEMASTHLDASLRADFARCISIADAVKFAKYRPSVQESEACLTTMTEVIRKMNPPKEEVKDGI